MASISDDDAAPMKSPSKVIAIPDDETDNKDGEATSDISLGGERSEKSFALLDGVCQDPGSVEKERVTIDITRLPAILGRSNESDNSNPHFFGLGKKKALSRKHCTIYYRDKEGGHAEWDDTEKATIYKDTEQMAKEHGAQSASKKKQPKPNPHLVSDNEEESGGLPPNGFFVIECLGKNRILVDQARVEQGESMVLRSGSAIRVSSYMFYFLLPTDAEPEPHTIEVPPSEEEKAAAAAAKMTKKKSPSKVSKGGKETSGKKATGKKRPVPTIALSAAKKPKKSTTSTGATTQAELEDLPVEDLLERMDEAVSKGLWDRRNQFIGATICFHAVRAAGASPEIQEKVANDGGVSRSDIMEWIEQSDKYGGWVQQMLTNMEPRSYQAAITKSLLKSGFERTSGAGRYIKWELPPDIPLKAKKKKKKAVTVVKTETKPNPKPKPPEPAKPDEEPEGDDNDDDDDDKDDDDDNVPPPGETPVREEVGEEGDEEASANDEDGGDDESAANEEEGNEEPVDDNDANESNPDTNADEQGAESETGKMDITI